MNSSLYINIGAESTSYKSLTFNKTAATTGWGLEGDTIITTTSSSYGRRKLPQAALTKNYPPLPSPSPSVQTKDLTRAMQS